jgi:hypothetical protein
MMRLAEDGIDFEGPRQRLGQRIISLADPDRMQVELIEAETANAPDGKTSARADLPRGEPRDDGLHSVTLWLSDFVPTARVLTDLFGYEAACPSRQTPTRRVDAVLRAKLLLFTVPVSLNGGDETADCSLPAGQCQIRELLGLKGTG